MADTGLLRRWWRFQIERKDGVVTFGQFKNVGMLVPADVEIGGCLWEQGAHGKKRGAFGVGQLKQTRRFSVHRDARTVNGGDGAGETDGGDAVGSHRHNDQYIFIQEIFDDFLGRLCQGNVGDEHRDSDR
jgi:hypothetical protein